MPRGADPNDQEVWFGENLRRLREERGISQTGLAKKMSARGFPFHQTTISRIEAGGRPVRLAEATTLAALVGGTVEFLTRPPDTAEAVNNLERAVAEVRGLLKKVEDSTRLATISKDWLKAAIERARRTGVEASPIRDAEEVLKAEPEDAVHQGRRRAERTEARWKRDVESQDDPSEPAYMRLKRYTNVGSVVSRVRGGETFILDMASMRDADGERAVDFVSGLAAGSGSTISNVKPFVFLICPPGVSPEAVISAYGLDTKGA